MADMSKFKPESNTDDLKAKDFIGKKLRLTIERVDTATYPGTDTQPANTKPVLYFVGKQKRLVLNGTNTETLCDAYGSESDAWIGKDISLTTKDYTSKGFGHGWIVQALGVEFEDDIPF